MSQPVDMYFDVPLPENVVDLRRRWRTAEHDDFLSNRGFYVPSEDRSSLDALLRSSGRYSLESLEQKFVFRTAGVVVREGKDKVNHIAVLPTSSDEWKLPGGQVGETAGEMVRRMPFAAALFNQFWGRYVRNVPTFLRNSPRWLGNVLHERDPGQIQKYISPLHHAMRSLDNPFQNTGYGSSLRSELKREFYEELGVSHESDVRIDSLTPLVVYVESRKEKDMPHFVSFIYNVRVSGQWEHVSQGLREGSRLGDEGKLFWKPLDMLVDVRDDAPYQPSLVFAARYLDKCTTRRTAVHTGGTYKGQDIVELPPVSSFDQPIVPQYAGVGGPRIKKKPLVRVRGVRRNVLGRKAAPLPLVG